MRRFDFPGGKRFAFTILDDTDVATVENVQSMYRLLERLGLRATKTVWPVECPEGSRNFHGSQTLEDASYRAFVLDLQRRGFEVTWHGATMESSLRERTALAMETFRDTFGIYPTIHVNHATNRENLYWGAARVDDPCLRFLLRRLEDRGAYVGHVERSPYWWGDLCVRHIEYARNLTFNELNLARINPSMPYRDPMRPLVPWWFSAADAEDAEEFHELLRPAHQQRLEEEGGFSIVATHLGKGYVVDGRIHPLVCARLEEISRRRGWFPTVGELLNWLRETGRGGALPRREWRRMQWRWARDLLVRRRNRRLRTRRVRDARDEEAAVTAVGGTGLGGIP